ncbi:hypothetical protein ACTFQF_20650 [Aliivibrio fischeri]|uniref:Uncharacterized protein n=2 Tax=Aliivibrio fischeri TaxID=668 RepID=Q5DYU5_ALIF1|nr:hypothetical protein [Aliivibrio fischeri]AAW88051.1 hypothetical protein VF_A0981 [Aliivibrio fischeri ES114]KLU80527.1 hypothetical protein AB192_01495 [Aliivibrio fischeri]MBP3139788.1 hypothetical protein [Aliivibrio fischeri]MBP3154173.1 hypothetical protein [Aliivibrio fischeri]MCE7536201.1 hypothetical protein [Aliivibrio fischeri]
MLSDRNSSVLDLTDVRYIERIVIGRYNPNNPDDDDFMQRQIDKLNHYLDIHPKGILIGKDSGFKVIKIGENTVISQHVAYHIGFKRKPVL